MSHRQSVHKVVHSRTTTVTSASEPHATPTRKPHVTSASEPHATPTRKPHVTSASKPHVTPTRKPHVTSASEPHVTPTRTPHVTSASEPHATPTRKPHVTSASKPQGSQVRVFWRHALWVLIGSGISGWASAGDASPTDKIILQALSPSPLATDLRHLTDEIGGRVTGSPAMARAVDWAVTAFRAAGVEVHTESYTLPVTWQEGVTHLDLIGPAQFAVKAVSVAWAPATEAGGIEAPIVDVGNGTVNEFAQAGPAVRDAIVLVNSRVIVSWEDLFDEYNRAPPIINRALQGGARAILWVGARDHLLLYRHTDAVSAEIAQLPMAIVAREDGLRLARAIAAYPREVRGRLSMTNRVGGPVQQQNVVGEIRGGDRAGEFVILGAHLDSWELGTGALDNGCNAAMVIAAARAIAAAAVQPRRTLRFVLFSGEEQGLLGSRAYVQQHRAELDKISAMITYDSGTGRVTGYSLGGRDDLEKPLTEVLAPLASWGVGRHTLDASPGTDNFDFLLEGVPNLVANQEEDNYMVNYHAASDTLDKVDFRNLQQHVAIAALTAFGIAQRKEPLGPRQSRGEIAELMQRTGLEQQLRTLGYWPEWESGARGRQP